MKFYGTLFSVAFGLNWIWEVFQTFAFDMSGVSVGQMLLFCTFASVLDAIVTVAIFWVLQKLTVVIGWKFYLFTAASGALCAVFFEQAAFMFNLWSYNERMPVLPFLGMGVLPVLQLMILVPAAIWLALKLRRD